MFNVLVLDAKQRSALAVTRSLGSLPDVNVSTADAASNALAGCSRYSTVYYSSPSSEYAPRQYLEWLVGHLQQHHYDLIIPVTEITSQLLLMNREQFAHLPMPFATYEQIMQLADKGKLVQLAQELGIRCPQSRWFASANELDLDAEIYPVVLKPCLSKIYTGDTWVATRVRVLYSREDFKDELQRSPYLYGHPFMLQQFIPGHGAGVFCLYDDGKPLAFFAHQRLREKPPQGGVSVLSESVAIDPRLQGYAQQLLDAVRWHGVAMIEFRMSPEGEAYLMEVNTRFWGSLQLAVDSGVDFPRLLWTAELAKTGLAPHPTAPESYRIGQRLRWLLGDFDSLYLYLKSDYSAGQKIKRVIEFLTPRLSGCRHEINRWGDVGPARHEFALYMKQLLGQ